MNYIKLVIGIIITIIIILLTAWGIIATTICVNLNNENVKIKTEKNLLLMDNKKYKDEAEKKQEIINEYEKFKVKIKNAKSTKELYQIVKEWE